jgi:hypothetical protein
VLESIRIPLNHTLYITIPFLCLYLSFVHQNLYLFCKLLQHCCEGYSADTALMNAWLGDYAYNMALSTTNLAAPSWYKRISWKYMSPSGRYTRYGYSYFPHSITTSSMNPCQSAITQEVSTKYIQFCRFWMVHQVLRYAVTTNARTSCTITTFRGVICKGSCSHSGSQCSIWGQHQGLVDVTSYVLVQMGLFSMCIGFSQPPILASVQSGVHKSCKYSAWGIHLVRRS